VGSLVVPAREPEAKNSRAKSDKHLVRKERPSGGCVHHNRLFCGGKWEIAPCFRSNWRGGVLSLVAGYGLCKELPHEL